MSFESQTGRTVTDGAARREDSTSARTGTQASALRQGILDHLSFSLGRLLSDATPNDYYLALALAVRDRLQPNWLDTTRTGE